MIPVFTPSAHGRRTPALYRRPSGLRRFGALALTAAGMLGMACRGGSSDDGYTADEWVQTDGAAGRINLDDVQQAYKDSFDDKQFKVDEFEKRVNEIYEGDHVVLVKVERVGDQVDVSGWEDLNDSKQIDESSDDKLFTISQELRDGGNYQLQGYGANGYYHEGGGFGGFGGFFTGMFLGSLLSGGRTTYVTAPSRYDEISSNRSSYRGSSGYATQQDRNQAFGSRASSKYGSAATSSPVSPTRSSYQQHQVSSGGFRSSGGSTRSIGSGGKSGGSAGVGGVRGGGGLVAL